MYLLVDFMKLVAESFSLTLKLSNFDFPCLWNVLLFLHFLGFVFCIHSCILMFNYGNFIIFIFISVYVKLRNIWVSIFMIGEILVLLLLS